MSMAQPNTESDTADLEREHGHLRARMAFFGTCAEQEKLFLPIAAVFAPYIGCRGGLYHLFEAGIRSVADLIERSRAELLSIPGLGSAKVEKIEVALEVLGLRLRSEPIPFRAAQVRVPRRRVAALG